MDATRDIEDVMAAWYNARDKRDADALASLYNDECGMIITPPGEIIKGRKRIKDHYFSRLNSILLRYDDHNYSENSIFISDKVVHLISSATQKTTGKLESFIDVFVYNESNSCWEIHFSSWTI